MAQAVAGEEGVVGQFQLGGVFLGLGARDCYPGQFEVWTGKELGDAVEGKDRNVGAEHGRAVVLGSGVNELGKDFVVDDAHVGVLADTSEAPGLGLAYGGAGGIVGRNKYQKGGFGVVEAVQEVKVDVPVLLGVQVVEPWFQVEPGDYVLKEGVGGQGQEDVVPGFAEGGEDEAVGFGGGGREDELFGVKGEAAGADRPSIPVVGSYAGPGQGASLAVGRVGSAGEIGGASSGEQFCRGDEAVLMEAGVYHVEYGAGPSFQGFLQGIHAVDDSTGAMAGPVWKMSLAG